MNGNHKMPERQVLSEIWAAAVNLLALYGANIMAGLAAVVIGICKGRLDGQPMPAAIMGGLIVATMALTMQPVITGIGLPGEWYSAMAAALAYLGPATVGRFLTRILTARVRAFTEPHRDE